MELLSEFESDLSQDERVSIVMNAYKHVLKLQKCVGDLNADLASLQNASASPVDGGLHPKDPAGTQTINMSSMNDVSYEHPEVYFHLKT